MEEYVATGTKDCLGDPEGDGDRGMRVIGWDVGKEPFEVRLSQYDFLCTRVYEVWPNINPSIVDAAKKRLFVNGERGNLGTVRPLPRSLWLDAQDLGRFAEEYGLAFFTVSHKEPLAARTYVPVTGHLKSIEPVGLLLVPNHWQRVWLKQGKPLPPVSLICWGKEEVRFLKAPTHAEVHAQWNFFAFRREPSEVGCGCRGAAP